MPKQELFEPLTWGFYEQGQKISAAQYMTAVTTMQLLSRQIAQFFEQYDVWLTPTLGRPPVRLGVIDRHGQRICRGFDRANIGWFGASAGPELHRLRR